MILDTWIEKFSSSVWKPTGIKLFRFLVYAWFICNLLYLFPARDLVWGRDSMILPLSNSPGLVNNLFFLLNYLRDFDTIIISIHAIALLISISGKWGWIPRLMVYLSAGMLYFPAYLALNGGYILMWLFSFYLIFANAKAKESTSIIMSNFAYMACVTQFLMVYTIAAWWKWTGDSWIDGSALFYVLHMDAYSSSWLQEFLLPQEGLLRGLTWFGLAYQSLFVVMIWLRRTKMLWLFLGLAFHLFIIFGIGLVDFGTAMIIGYVLFLDEGWITSKLKKIRRQKLVKEEIQ